jgi:hypothetical protein
MNTLLAPASIAIEKAMDRVLPFTKSTAVVLVIPRICILSSQTSRFVFNYKMPQELNIHLYQPSQA